MATRYYIDEEQWYAPKKKRSGALRAVLIFIVVLVLIAIIGCGGAYIMGWQMTGEPNPANWSIFKGDKNKSDKAVIAVTSDGVALTDGATCETGGGITYFMRSAGNTEYIPAGEITLTATLSNEFINGAFDWSVEWTNPAAEWANGKTAANYVSVTPTADGSASATLHFLAKFNEQIIVKAQLRGTESQDTSTVDCLKSATMSAPSLCFTDFDDPFDFEADVELSEGTVTGDFKIDRASVYLHNNFVNSVKNYLTFNIDIAPFGLANLSENSKSFTLLSDSYLTTQ